MIAAILVLVLIQPSSILSQQADPITHTFLTLLKETAIQHLGSAKDAAVMSKIKNLNLGHLADQSANTKSGELDHQVSGPRPEVRVANGLVTGETVAGSHAFYSIPYGKPPIGPLR